MAPRTVPSLIPWTLDGEWLFPKTWGCPVPNSDTKLSFRIENRAVLGLKVCCQQCACDQVNAHWSKQLGICELLYPRLPMPQTWWGTQLARKLPSAQVHVLQFKSFHIEVYAAEHLWGLGPHSCLRQAQQWGAQPGFKCPHIRESFGFQ